MPKNTTSAGTSPFAMLEARFALLAAGPRPLALDCTGIEGLPDRAIPLDELRGRLLHPSTAYATRDAALRLLLGRAQVEGGAWTVGLAGAVLPGMRRGLTQLEALCWGRTADLEAEMLAGLVGAIASCDPERTQLAGYLCGRAFNAAKRLAFSELAERARPVPLPGSIEPRRPFGHPDFVLGRAVAEGVLGADDAELIGSTRLGELTLTEAAQLRGLTYDAAERRRHRAETALVAWIRTGFVGNRSRSGSSKGAGRPRQGRGGDRAAGTSPKPNAHDREEVQARPVPEGPAAAAPGPNPKEVTPTKARLTRAASLALRALPFLVAVVLALVLAAQPAHADAPAPPTLNAVIDSLRTWLVGVLAGLATLFLTIGGIRYLVAGGDPAEVERAKVALKSAAIGYALAALAPLIVSILQSVVG